jgi:hypothetical protein
MAKKKKGMQMKIEFLKECEWVIKYIDKML